MFERLEFIKNRYNELEEQLMDPEVLKDIKKSSIISKELSNIRDVVLTYEEYKKTNDDLECAKEMLNDNDLKEMAKEEINEATAKLKRLYDEIQILLIPKDPNDDKNIIVEIRGAAGGDEANIFAGDLFRMYQRYAEKEGWKLEVLNESPGTSGGFSQIEFMIKGNNVYSKLKYESGSHRVQRVPLTETQGRVHTSTATVLVMPEATDIEIDIKEADLKVEVTRSSGAGGQHVNTTDSAVRMTHIKTGISVYCQDGRSQIKNREKAFILLKTRVYEAMQREKETEEEKMRRSKIGTGDRSEKIRTYNYPQNRITDHRIGLTIMNLDRVMEGDMDTIIESLVAEDQRRKLETI